MYVKTKTRYLLLCLFLSAESSEDATPESVLSSSASPESGVLAADVLVLEPSEQPPNSPESTRELLQGLAGVGIDWKVLTYVRHLYFIT